MTQQPIDKNNSASTSLAFAKLRKLDKRITAIEVDSNRNYSFTIFHPDGRVGQLEQRIEKLEESNKTNTKAIVEAWRSNIPSRVKVRPFSLFEFTVNLCAGLILASATAMITRIAYDFVTMPDGAAVESVVEVEK